MVTGPHKRRRSHKIKTDIECLLPVPVKDSGFNITLDRQMMAGRLEILSNGQHSHTMTVKVPDGLDDFFIGFPKPDHQPRFPGYAGTALTEPLQQVKL